VKLRKYIAGLAVPLLLATLFPMPTALADSRCYKYRDAERAFVRKMNRARGNAGKVRLSLDPEAGKVARRHAAEMAGKNLLHHTPSTTLKWRVTRWSVLGENVGVGSTVSSLHKAFMNSPAHKANILYSSFRHVGVGTVRKNGRLWVTVVFESSQDPGTRLRMPKC
jgi:uncharacterized protein YkwD